MPAILSAVAIGPTLVVVPAVDQAMLLGARLRRSGLTVAVMPDGLGRARPGASTW